MSLFDFTVARDGNRFALYRRSAPGTDTDRRWHLVFNGNDADVAQGVATCIAPTNVDIVENVAHLHTGGVWMSTVTCFSPLTPRQRVEAEIANLEEQAAKAVDEGIANHFRDQAAAMRQTLDLIYGDTTPAGSTR